MITFKDFSVGQQVYLCYFHVGRSTSPEIIKTTVKTVGRKYVTIDFGNKKFTQYDGNRNLNALIEYSEIGESSFLFPSEELVKNELQCRELYLQINKNLDNLEFLSKDDLQIILNILKRKSNVSLGYLYDWYQNSVSEEDIPVWTDEHINELYQDFFLIPKCLTC